MVSKRSSSRRKTGEPRFKGVTYFLLILLLTAGDVEANPGPNTSPQGEDGSFFLDCCKKLCRLKNSDAWETAVDSFLRLTRILSEELVAGLEEIDEMRLEIGEARKKLEKERAAVEVEQRKIDPSYKKDWADMVEIHLERQKEAEEIQKRHQILRRKLQYARINLNFLVDQDDEDAKSDLGIEGLEFQLLSLKDDDNSYNDNDDNNDDDNNGNDNDDDNDDDNDNDNRGNNDGDGNNDSRLSPYRKDVFVNKIWVILIESPFL